MPIRWSRSCGNLPGVNTPPQARRPSLHRLLAPAVVVAWATVMAAAQPSDPLPRVMPSAVRLSPEPLAAATALLQQHVDAGRSAGVVAMLARDGKLAWVATVGVQDLATRAPMTERTLFRIYSMTKPVTAVAVMMLLEQGKFALDEPVSKYLPEFAGVTVRTPDGPRAPARTPTIRDLLLHTSGLEHRTSAVYRDAQVRSRTIGLPQFVKNIVQVPLMEDPGTRYRRDQYGAPRCATPSCDTNARTSVWRPAHQPSGASPSPRSRPTRTIGRRGHVAAATPASRSFVLAPLRALHLDPEAPTPAQQQRGTGPAGPARPKTQPTHEIPGT